LTSGYLDYRSEVESKSNEGIHSTGFLSFATSEPTFHPGAKNDTKVIHKGLGLHCVPQQDNTAISKGSLANTQAAYSSDKAFGLNEAEEVSFYSMQ
jgi:hypothetical protein